VTEQVIVRMGDLRSLRYCARGVREFFARHELDYNDFLQNGIPAEKLLAASGNDAMAVAAVEVARGRHR
jgi:hypothetical protein